MPSLDQALPAGNPLPIEPDCLLLDPGNLRLLEHVSPELLETRAEEIGTAPIQDRLLEVIREEPNFKLESLISSIRANGFLRNDHLIVAPYDGSRYLVLEGNRRVSAVKIIKNSSLRSDAGLFQSIASLPCYVLDGDPISGSDEKLKHYREIALQFIGIRHLTGIEQWEPASRYEFLARLIEEYQLSPQQVAQRFGKETSEILRDYRAHILYRTFREFEVEKGVRRHFLTYNTFAEASRSRDIRQWLEWSDAATSFLNTERVHRFYEYVVSQLRSYQPGLFGDDEDDVNPEKSAERVVRRFRDMLKRKDPEIEGNLEEGAFEKAHELFDLRKLGRLEQRIAGYISGLRSVSKSEMQDNPHRTIELLKELEKEAQELRSFIERII